MADGGEDVTPGPGALIESLRDFGYTLPTAIADLIDNSLTANALDITVAIASATNEVPAHIAVLDDGDGMSHDRLIGAMRLGTVGPLARRGPADLGRFGLGLKTASLSQGRCITVVTRPKGGKTVVRRFDLEHISESGSWQLLCEGTGASAAYENLIRTKSSGTAVVIERLDRTSFLEVPAARLAENLGRALDEVAKHLEMVFHRFLEDGRVIRIGSRQLGPWDPFLRGRSTALPPEPLPVRGEEIMVRPFVLPHHSKLNDEEHDAAAGIHGWNAHQGFYIYRAGRLIVPGTWLGLFKKEEHYKLARIAVELPNSLDDLWHLNVMKSHVAAPAWLRDGFRRIADRARRDASAVYRLRGERLAPLDVVAAERFVWKRTEGRRSVKYRIDRSHPVLRALLHGGCAHEDLLNRALQLLEDTIPIATILQDPAKALDGSNGLVSDNELDTYVTLVVHAEQFLVRAGKSPREARAHVLNAEPFVELRDRLLPLLPPIAGPA